MLHRRRLRRVTQTLDERYPDTLRHAYLYSVPAFLRLFFFVLRRWMDPETGEPPAPRARWSRIARAG
eukprot:scaffold310_cov302-Prasinococcus_capsulatus_cf.AAC.11